MKTVDTTKSTASLRHFELRSRQHFTISGEKTGELARSLAAESTEDLQTAYLAGRCSSDFSNPIFGGTARRYESFIARALRDRGVESFFWRDIFGTRTVVVK